MNASDFDFYSNSNREPLASSEPEPESDFGLLDVIEAFTAMRHEWRTQTRENRELAQTILQAEQRIAEFQDHVSQSIGLQNSLFEQATTDDTARRLADALVQLEWSVTRAIDVVIQTGEDNATLFDITALKADVRQHASSLGVLSRWFSRPLIKQMESTIDSWAEKQKPAQNLTAGLEILSERIRRLVSDQAIERVDVNGEWFDGETMNAVEAVECDNIPSGRVVEQLCPAYRWRGRLIKYAEVRVAK